MKTILVCIAIIGTLLLTGCEKEPKIDLSSQSDYMTSTNFFNPVLVGPNGAIEQ